MIEYRVGLELTLCTGVLVCSRIERGISRSEHEQPLVVSEYQIHTEICRSLAEKRCLYPSLTSLLVQSYSSIPSSKTWHTSASSTQMPRKLLSDRSNVSPTRTHESNMSGSSKGAHLETTWRVQGASSPLLAYCLTKTDGRMSAVAIVSCHVRKLS